MPKYWKPNLEDAHRVDNSLLDRGCALDGEVGQEVVGDSDQRVLGPALEPVHGAAGNQTRKLERARSELLADLIEKNTFRHKLTC